MFVGMKSGFPLGAFYSLKSDVRTNSERINNLEKIQAIEIGHIKNSLQRIERTVERSTR